MTRPLRVGSPSTTCRTVPSSRRSTSSRPPSPPPCPAWSPPAATTKSTASSPKSGDSSTGKLLSPAASESPTYDDDGNLTSDSLWTYTWNGENRVVAMQSQGGVATDFRYRLEFKYDWMGRRIQKVSKTWNSMTGTYATSGTTLKFLYDGWNILSELDGSNNQLRTYMWGPDLSGSLTGAGALRFGASASFPS